MSWLYGLALLSWAAVLCYMTPAVWSIYVAQTRHGDPARLVCLLFAATMIGFLARRLIVRQVTVDPSMIVLLIASIGVAIFTLHTARTYGRGKRV